MPAWGALADVWQRRKLWREVRERRGEIQALIDMVPVSLSSVYSGTWSPRRLKRAAWRCVTDFELNRRENRRALEGDRCRERLNEGALHEARQQGRGLICCSIHLGPYHFVVREMLTVFPRVGVYSAPHFVAEHGEAWKRSAERINCEVELLPSDSPRSLLRAHRILKAGGVLVIYVDVENHIGGGEADRHAVELEFLGMPVRMRQGAGYLSQRSQTPMILSAVWRHPGGRKTIEYSDVLAPVAPEAEAGLGERTREMFSWFERRILDHPTQWDGWGRHVFMLQDTGRRPSVSPDVWDEQSRRVEQLLASSDPGYRLRAEPTHVGWHKMRGEPPRYVVYDGPRRLILKSSSKSCELLDAAYKKTPLTKLPQMLGLDPADCSREVTRLVLSGLAHVERGRRFGPSSALDFPEAEIVNSHKS